ncbi:uncharacterized protein ARMOST_09788 [Armillaria ostoyae]|uniref:Uncharacterized protein n=1 Tax=Armillaria ostoyae TaxID=47428 RepID=A0A284RCF6_ARMOS|nr:uncharacterized protein ARMOST_09788 [Armillaria ostoyae]
MLFFIHVYSMWFTKFYPMRAELLNGLYDALRHERSVFDNNPARFEILFCSIAKLPSPDHPHVTVRVYDTYAEFLGALHYYPRQPERAQFLPDTMESRWMRIFDRVLNGILRDFMLYFNPAVNIFLVPMFI